MHPIHEFLQFPSFPGQSPEAPPPLRQGPMLDPRHLPGHFHQPLRIHPSRGRCQTDVNPPRNPYEIAQHQEEYIDWGEVADARGTCHLRDTWRMKKCSTRRSRRLCVKQLRGSCASSRLGVRIVEPRLFSRRDAEPTERNASLVPVFPSVLVGRLPSPSRLGGGHNRDAVVSDVGIKPRVVLVPRPTLG